MLLMLQLAAAHESEPAEVAFRDELDLFSMIGFDTGYLPSINDPISVRFHVTPTGSLTTAMDASSNLLWPAAFEHALEAEGGGLFAIETFVEVEFEIHIDVVGVFQASLPVWQEDFEITASETFDTLLLPGSSEAPLELMANNAVLDPFAYSFDVVSGLAALEFEVALEPELFASLAGNRIETTMGDSTGSLETEGGLAMLDPMPGSPGEVFLQSTYFADIVTTATLVLSPTARLDTIVGDFDLVNLPIPIELLSNSETRAFEPETYVHPLPVLELPGEAFDFGEVPLTQLRNLELPLVNLGVLGLEGTASIEGSDAFTVFPGSFFATEGTTDGVVVSFLPVLEGGSGATLVLTSNDPVNPEVRIPLSGTGFDEAAPPVSETPPPDPATPPESLSGEDVKGCGCRKGSGGLPWVWWVPLLTLCIRRR